MKKSIHIILTIFISLIANNVSAQIWNTPDANGNVTTNTTTAPIVKNVIVGPTPTTPTPLYINNTTSTSSTLSIDHNYTLTTAPQYTYRQSGIDFNLGGSNVYKIYASTKYGCGSGYLHISPNSSSSPGIHLNGSTISFTSTDATNQCANSTVSGKYMFDGTIGSPDINIGYSSSLPIGYKLINSGASYFKDKVVIGTTNTAMPTGTHKLYVGGSVICEELIVKLQANWPDFVFAPSYKLKPLSEVKTYIAENNHLPDVPAACEVQENGIATGEMLTIQMKKIEELTLYLIQMEERIKELEVQNKALSK